MKFLVMVLASVAVAFASKSASVYDTKWALIHTVNQYYLQLEMSGLPGGIEPVIDSVKSIPNGNPQSSVQHANLRVYWQNGAIKEAEGSKIRIAQVLRALGGSNLKVDTIVSCQSGICQNVASFQEVDNTGSKLVICILYACDQPDSATARANLLKSMAAANWVAILDPTLIKPFVKPTWWRQTDGTENDSEVVAPLMLSNAKNWINRDNTVFGVSRWIKSKPSDPTTYEVPTGKVEYVYNRATSPVTMPPSLDLARLFLDTLLKNGPEINLSGSYQRKCDRVPFDTMMAKSQWIVVAASAADVPNAMVFDSRCNRRNAAWKVVDDTVWLNSRSKVSLSEILNTLSVSRPVLQKAKVRIAIEQGRQILNLPEASRVSVTTMDGRILSSAIMAAGTHDLNIDAGRNLVLVHVLSERGGEVSVVPVLR